MRTIGFNVDSPATASRQKMTPACDLHITVTCGWVLKEKKTPQIANLQQIVWPRKNFSGTFFTYILKKRGQTIQNRRKKQSAGGAILTVAQKRDWRGQTRKEPKKVYVYVTTR